MSSHDFSSAGCPVITIELMPGSINETRFFVRRLDLPGFTKGTLTFKSTYPAFVNKIMVNQQIPIGKAFCDQVKTP